MTGLKTIVREITPPLFYKIVHRAKNKMRRVYAGSSPNRSIQGRAEQASGVEFTAIMALATNIEGMLSPFSIKVLDSILSFQRELEIRGHLIEFGVYKGKSAAVLSAHPRQDERLVLADVEQYITDQTIGSLFSQVEFVLGRSEDFARNFPDFATLKSSVRFMHIDSSHAYQTTFNELALADELLSADGIACLDDFTNLNYSQILPALYKYLYTVRTDLTVFLVTNEKCYLCRKPAFERYGAFILDRMTAEMARRGDPATCLARTDWDPEYRAFYLRPQLSASEGPLYGAQLYHQFYRTP